MSVNHHGDDQSELIRMFQEQLTGTRRRQWDDGRINGNDDGCLAYAMATDDSTRTILIRFPKPTEWIGLDVKSATELRDQLTERLLALKVGKA